MKLLDYFLSLESEPDRADYANRAGTTLAYLTTHVFVPQKRRKIPRVKLIKGLAEASGGKVSLDDVLEFLYKTEINKTS